MTPEMPETAETALVILGAAGSWQDAASLSVPCWSKTATGRVLQSRGPDRPPARTHHFPNSVEWHPRARAELLAAAD